MILRTRHFIKFLVFMAIIFGLCYHIYYSFPVQQFLYPIHHQEYVFHYSQVYKIDPYLVAAVIRVESRFSHTAESGSGARGLMQIMPETAKWAAERLGIDFHPEMLFDPEYNIRLGCWYLRELEHSFNGNLAVVLAAYNAGQGNVKKWLDGGVWDGQINHLDQIPYQETRVYVDKVWKYYQRYCSIYQKKEAY